MKKDGKLTRTILNSILPVILAFVLGGFIILAIGENPLETYGILTGNPSLRRRDF